MAVAVAFYACTPVMTLILAHTFLRRMETIDFLVVAGTMLSVVGVILVILGATG